MEAGQLLERRFPTVREDAAPGADVPHLEGAVRASGQADHAVGRQLHRLHYVTMLSCQFELTLFIALDAHVQDADALVGEAHGYDEAALAAAEAGGDGVFQALQDERPLVHSFDRFLHI